MSIYLEAKKSWIYFLENKIDKYEKFRNFDYGPKEESPVSKLSPYISHRVLFEYELINEINTKYKNKNFNKFIQEIYWRIYWKGWLENRPKVWRDFISGEDYKFDNETYKKALNGQTDLFFFNSWIQELKTYNYLHNHTRMWFASTWVFNLGLPWQLGAKLFFKHLYDGDASSNLLSWRWVAGLQTKGKPYLFSAANLNKFSNKRFNLKKINNKKIIFKQENYINLNYEIYKNNFKKKSDYLLLFENDLHIETLKNILMKYKKVFILLLKNEQRKIKISGSVYSFKQALISEFVGRFSNVEQIDPNKIKVILKDVPHIDIIYPGIGENYDFINNFKIVFKKRIFNLVRDYDLFAWKFAERGFFKFKENIPHINSYIAKSKDKNA